MPSDYTTTSALADSLPTVVAAARSVREHAPGMPGLVDKQTLGTGRGNTWREISIERLTAQTVASETTDLDNPQQYVDTLFTITPTVVGIQTYISDRVRARVDKQVLRELGQAMQRAIDRRKDLDGITVLDGATTALGTAGTTFASSYIAAAATRIRGDSDEPGPEPLYAGIHPNHAYDLYTEQTSGIGTYIVSPGRTADTFANGFAGKVSNVAVHELGNMTRDDEGDSKGGVWSKQGIVLVQGRSPWTFTRKEPQRGGGGDSLWLYDEYAYGERSSGNWLYELHFDSSDPTS